MGKIVTISVQMDAYDEFLNNPQQFIENIKKGSSGEENYPVKSVNEYPVGCHCNPMQVSLDYSSNQGKLFFIKHNLMSDLGGYSSKNGMDIDIRKQRYLDAENLLKREAELIQENDPQFKGNIVKNKEDIIKELEELQTNFLNISKDNTINNKEDLLSKISKCLKLLSE